MDTAYNIQMNYSKPNNDIENLADTIQQVQNVQDDVNYYKDHVSTFLNDGNSTGGFSLDGLLDWVRLLANWI